MHDDVMTVAVTAFLMGEQSPERLPVYSSCQRQQLEGSFQEERRDHRDEFEIYLRHCDPTYYIYIHNIYQERGVSQIIPKETRVYRFERR